MSLDIYLIVPGAQVVVEPDQIWIREDGCQRQLTRAEWHASITHNLGPMAAACGVYEACWRPDALGITRAGDLVERLTTGLRTLSLAWQAMGDYLPPNGWGTRETLRTFLEHYLAACAHWPEATIQVGLEEVEEAQADAPPASSAQEETGGG